MEVLSEVRVDDPICISGGTLRVARRVDPVAGPQIVLMIICSDGGYRYYEEMPENIGGGGLLSIEVRGPEDLSRVILRSRSAAISIPEIGLVSTPRAGAVDEITTVDGILEKYVEHLEPICGETENPGRCYEVVEWMKRAMRGEERFTLVIEDPSGRSRELSLKI